METPIRIPGFYFAGLHCGIKDVPEKKDLAVIYALAPRTSVAGVFTQNRLCAAPVTLCRQNLRSGVARVVVINSGVANAATGALGLKDAKSVAAAAAKTFAVAERQVFVCSTGKIGPRVPVAKIVKGMKEAKDQLHVDNFHLAAESIRTTDAYKKVAYHEGILGKTRFRMAVMAKGAGMIHPNMATMLCYMLTDLKIDSDVLQAALKSAVDVSLNCLTVDGDTSTNDTVLALASGMCENATIRKNSPSYKKLVQIMSDLLRQITVLIASDGEGATKCFHVRVQGAKNDAEAKSVSRWVGNSPLVKTAMYGNDPNWGRILCAVGNAGVETNPDTLKIKIGKWPLYSGGKTTAKNDRAISEYLKSNKLVTVDIDLGIARGHSEIFSSDLTPDYVKFNADYST